MHPTIVDKAGRLPAAPGVYLFLAADGAALYVGKAADLRARVRSYLRPGGDGRLQLRFLEREAADLEFVATATEQDALLLENTVIKQRQPRYNLKLKDDKAFLLLRLDRREPWPWYRLVRRRQEDGALYFGPYASAKAVRRVLRLLHKVVPLRDCTDAVFDNRSRPCLKHQIGRCPAPCVGRIDRVAYDELLERSLRLLRGDVGPLLQQLREAMLAAAEALQFERAHVLKQQLEAVQLVAERRTVAGGEGDADAFAVHRAGDRVTAAVLTFRGGMLEDCQRWSWRSELPDDLLFGELLGRCYEGDRYVPKTVLLPVLPAESAIVAHWLEQKRGGRVELIVPRRGDRRAKLELAQQNARLGDAIATDAETRAVGAATRLASMLSLPDVPQRLHCIDVSTIQGSNTVASRVCFVDGKPDKGQYRRFKISAAHAGDDFAAMAEAVRRSLQLCLERDDEELPDLLVLDGGPGQLAAAVRAAAELGIGDDLRCCGLAKSRLRGVGASRAETGERVFLPGATEPLPLANGAPETLLLAALRDEAHRFAITYHRKRRGTLTSELDAIAGVGPTRRRLLLRHLGSLSAVRAASLEELQRVPGLPAPVAAAIYAHWHPEPGEAPPAG